MTRSNAARFASLASTLSIAFGLGGCAWISSWFTKTPKAPAPVAVTMQAPQSDLPLQPESAARAACANYAQAVTTAPFPREAVIRGIDQGSASAQFIVDGTKVTLLSVRSSDPAFGNAAADIIGTLDCHVDRPTRFDVPFSWRTVR